ncbi:HIRAN domain-containing protein [Singulisphaera rosea]
MPGDEAAEGAVEVYRSICARAMEDGVISPAEERLLTQLGQALDLDSVDRSRLLDEATKKWTLQTAQVASEERQRIEASQAELVRRSLNVGSDETPLVTAGADTVEKLGRMHSKVAGVTMTNDDGSSRQHLIRRYCRAGQRLVVVREPDNPYDTHAVAIYLARPKASIGFIGSHISPFLGATIDRGGRVDVTISEVTGGKGGKYYGANIVIDFTKLPDVKRSWAKKKT